MHLYFFTVDLDMDVPVLEVASMNISSSNGELMYIKCMYSHVLTCIFMCIFGASMSEPHIDVLNMYKSVCMYLCMSVSKFDTNFTYSDSDPLR